MRYRRRAFLASILIASTAGAADFRAEGTTIYLDGPIARGDVDTLRGMLGANPDATRISIHSPGGDLATGLALGKLIRERKLETYVEGGVREAASAAAYAFMGGETRIVKGTRGVGVHAFYTPSSQVRSMIKQKSTDELVQTLNEFERATQESTMAVVEYVIAMIGDTRIVAEAVKSGSDAMLWPATDTLLSMKVATKRIELSPEEIPDPDWALGETIGDLSLWLTPGYRGPNATEQELAPEVAPDMALDERERETLEAFLASEPSQQALRADLERLLTSTAPPNRLRARETLIRPLVRSILASVRRSVETARSQEAAGEAR